MGNDHSSLQDKYGGPKQNAKSNQSLDEIGLRKLLFASPNNQFPPDIQFINTPFFNEKKKDQLNRELFYSSNQKGYIKYVTQHIKKDELDFQRGFEITQKQKQMARQKIKNITQGIKFASIFNEMVQTVQMNSVLGVSVPLTFNIPYLTQDESSAPFEIEQQISRLHCETKRQNKKSTLELIWAVFNVENEYLETVPIEELQPFQREYVRMNKNSLMRKGSQQIQNSEDAPFTLFFTESMHSNLKDSKNPQKLAVSAIKPQPAQEQHLQQTPTVNSGVSSQNANTMTDSSLKNAPSLVESLRDRFRSNYFVNTTPISQVMAQKHNSRVVEPTSVQRIEDALASSQSEDSKISLRVETEPPPAQIKKQQQSKTQAQSTVFHEVSAQTEDNQQQQPKVSVAVATSNQQITNSMLFEKGRNNKSLEKYFEQVSESPLHKKDIAFNSTGNKNNNNKSKIAIVSENSTPQQKKVGSSAILPITMQSQEEQSGEKFWYDGQDQQHSSRIQQQPNLKKTIKQQLEEARQPPRTGILSAKIESAGTPKTILKPHSRLVTIARDDRPTTHNILKTAHNKHILNNGDIQQVPKTTKLNAKQLNSDVPSSPSSARSHRSKQVLASGDSESSRVLAAAIQRTEIYNEAKAQPVSKRNIFDTITLPSNSVSDYRAQNNSHSHSHSHNSPASVHPIAVKKIDINNSLLRLSVNKDYCEEPISHRDKQRAKTPQSALLGQQNQVHLSKLFSSPRRATQDIHGSALNSSQRQSENDYYVNGSSAAVGRGGGGAAAPAAGSATPSRQNLAAQRDTANSSLTKNNSNSSAGRGNYEANIHYTPNSRIESIYEGAREFSNRDFSEDRARQRHKQGGQASPVRLGASSVFARGAEQNGRMRSDEAFAQRMRSQYGVPSYQQKPIFIEADWRDQEDGRQNLRRFEEVKPVEIVADFRKEPISKKAPQIQTRINKIKTQNKHLGNATSSAREEQASTTNPKRILKMLQEQQTLLQVPLNCQMCIFNRARTNSDFRELALHQLSDEKVSIIFEKCRGYAQGFIVEFCVSVFDGAFSGKSYMMKMIFPNRYPEYPPAIFVQTPLFHPNMNLRTHQFYMPLLDVERWTIVNTLFIVFVKLKCMMLEPDFSHIPATPENIEAAILFEQSNLKFFELKYEYEMSQLQTAATDAMQMQEEDQAQQESGGEEVLKNELSNAQNATATTTELVLNKLRSEYQYGQTQTSKEFDQETEKMAAGEGAQWGLSHDEQQFFFEADSPVGGWQVPSSLHRFAVQPQSAFHQNTSTKISQQRWQNYHHQQQQQQIGVLEPQSSLLTCNDNLKGLQLATVSVQRTYGRKKRSCSQVFGDSLIINNKLTVQQPRYKFK